MFFTSPHRQKFPAFPPATAPSPAASPSPHLFRVVSQQRLQRVARPPSKQRGSQFLGNMRRAIATFLPRYLPVPPCVSPRVREHLVHRLYTHYSIKSRRSCLPSFRPTGRNHRLSEIRCLRVLTPVPAPTAGSASRCGGTYMCMPPSILHLSPAHAHHQSTASCNHDKFPGSRHHKNLPVSDDRSQHLGTADCASIIVRQVGGVDLLWFDDAKIVYLSSAACGESGHLLAPLQRGRPTIRS